MFTVEINGKDVLVSHPSSPEPKVLPGWTWHADLVRQLIAERDELRARLAAIDEAPTAAIVDKAGPMLDIIWRDPEQALTLPHGAQLIARPEAK